MKARTESHESLNYVGYVSLAFVFLFYSFSQDLLFNFTTFHQNGICEPTFLLFTREA